MHWLHMLFGFGGRLARTPFIVASAAVAVTFVVGIKASEAALPWMAQVLAPRGINAGLALNVIWSLLWLSAIWAALALGAKRLHDRGLSGWWAAAAVLPLAALAFINDGIFLVSRNFSLPSAMQYAVLVAAGAIAAWVLYETVLQPSQDAADRRS